MTQPENQKVVVVVVVVVVQCPLESDSLFQSFNSSRWPSGQRRLQTSHNYECETKEGPGFESSTKIIKNSLSKIGLKRDSATMP